MPRAQRLSPLRPWPLQVPDRWLEIDPCLEGNHARRGIAAVAVAQEPIVRRSHRADRAYVRERRRRKEAASRRARIREVRMVEDVVALELQLQGDLLRHLEALGDIKVGPLESRTAQERAVVAHELA